MQAILLCAGQGKRLGMEIPKCMVEIGGEPLLKGQLDVLLGISSISKIIVVTGYKSELVENYIRDNYNDQRIIIEYNSQYGSLGIVESMRCAMKHITEDDVIRISGDLYFYNSIVLNPYITENQTIFLTKTIIPKNDFRKNIPLIVLNDNTNVVKEINLVYDLQKVNSSLEFEWIDLEKYSNGDLFKVMNNSFEYRTKEFNYCDLLNASFNSIEAKCVSSTNDFFHTIAEIDTPDDLLEVKSELAQSVSNTFWQALNKYPDFPSHQLRQDIDVVKISRFIQSVDAADIQSVLEIGCGDCYVLKQLEKEYSIYGIELYGLDYINSFFIQQVNKIREAGSKINFGRLPSLPSCRKADFVFFLGGLHYVINKKAISDFKKEINNSNKYLLIRCPCDPHKTTIINKYSEELRAQYAAIYRTVQDVISLFSNEWNLLSIERAFHDDVESKFGTKQYYFLFERKL